MTHLVTCVIHGQVEPYVSTGRCQICSREYAKEYARNNKIKLLEAKESRIARRRPDGTLAPLQKISTEAAERKRVREMMRYETRTQVVAAVEDFLQCNQCRYRAENVRDLYKHKKAHSPFQWPDEVSSMLPSTAEWI